MSQGSVVETPHVNALPEKAEAVAGRRVEDFDDVSVLKKLFQTSGREQPSVKTCSEQVNLTLTRLDLDKSQCGKHNALK